MAVPAGRFVFRALFYRMMESHACEQRRMRLLHQCGKPLERLNVWVDEGEIVHLQPDRSRNPGSRHPRPSGVYSAITSPGDVGDITNTWHCRPCNRPVRLRISTLEAAAARVLDDGRADVLVGVDV